MSTVNDIVTAAFRKCGIRDTTNTTLWAEGLATFNMMIKSWEEILQHAITNENFTLTSGTASYTIGSGGALDTVRPSKIVSAYLRDSDGIDYELNVNMSQEEYNDIDDKDVSQRPKNLFYNPSNPLGYIYFDYAPDYAYTLFMSSHKPIAVYAALTDTLLQPVEYEKALIYNLAIDIAEENNIQLVTTVTEQAMIEKNKITIRNSEPRPLAKLDNALPGMSKCIKVRPIKFLV